MGRSINQTAGTITAGTVTGSSGSTATFNQSGNAVTNLGAFSGAVITFVDNVANLGLTGSIASTDGSNLTNAGGNVVLASTEGVGLVFAPYVFGAGGELFLQNPTMLELGHVRAASYGAGLRIGGGQVGTLSNGSLLLEFARQARSDGLRDDNRFNLVSSIPL